MRLNIDRGMDLYEGSPITAYTSADGSIFYSCQGKKGSFFGMFIFRQMPDGSLRQIPVEENVFGQGQLVLQDGNLYLVAWNGNGGVPIYQHIREFVPRTSNGTPISIPTPVSDPALEGRVRALEVTLESHRNSLDFLTKKINHVSEMASSALGTLQGLEIPMTVKDLKDLIWSVSGDRIAVWWNAGVTYQTPQLYNAIWNRTAKILSWVKDNPDKELPLNKDETLKM